MNYYQELLLCIKIIDYSWIIFVDYYYELLLYKIIMDYYYGLLLRIIIMDYYQVKLL